MLEDVTYLGLNGFYTYHFTEMKMFRPCATRTNKDDLVLKMGILMTKT